MSFEPAVHFTWDRRACLLMEPGDDDHPALFIADIDGEVDLFTLSRSEFLHHYQESPDYPAARAARHYLNSTATISPRAATMLRNLTEPTMATSKKSTKKSTKPAPKKATAKQAATKPAPKAGAVIGKVMNAGKTDAKVGSTVSSKPAPKGAVKPTKAPGNGAAKTSGRKPGSGARIRELLRAGKLDTAGILAVIHKEFPESTAKASDVAWNKGKMRRDGEKI